ncbi:conserved hypothetical protein [Ricinus communis]|uniref:Uncharacterized protein n=1 Tax=Ricinus communis TaxID=3988 RepID=B9RQ04_RICCO|nr:conserved hypothetical protein [Ricinus communis]
MASENENTDNSTEDEKGRKHKKVNLELVELIEAKIEKKGTNSAKASKPPKKEKNV